ncbi:MAG: efflux transporter outer membrane subunit [Muribaculum sp.]|nr:efflux transporter outer membrane subunit [Muribaculum sp.]
MRKRHVILLFIYAMTGWVLPAMAQEHPSGSRYLEQPMPERWTYTPEVSDIMPNEDAWWKSFNDPLLDSLITVGVENNYNIRMAMSRIEMARQVVGQVRAGYFPSISINAGYTKSRISGATSGKDAPASNSSYFSLGADVSWEIDLFGRITAQVKEKKASVEVSKADYMASMVSITADIASYYMELRTLQAELTVAEEHLKSQQQVLNIAEARHEAGLVSKLDVAQAKTVFYSTEAALPALKANIRTTINAIAILLGTYPDKLYGTLGVVRPQPRHKVLISTGIPIELLRRRPDIIVAEKELAVYAAQLGIAKKDFLPALSLNGSIGVSSHRMDDMFKKNSFEYTIAPTLSWTLFDGLSRRYAVAEARTQMEIGIEDYNLTVITAVQEVDNAISSYNSAVETIEIDRKVFEQSQEEFNLSLEQYKEGLSAFTNVVDAQISWLNYANSLVEAKGNALASLIQLYQALGGSPVQ